MPATGKILLIDGDAPRRQALTQGVENAGYRVMPVPDYDKLQVDAARKASAILCATAPGLNEALAFCAELRQGDKAAEPLLLAYTTEMEEILRLRFLESGADLVVSAEALVPTLSQYVPPGKAARSRTKAPVETTAGGDTVFADSTSSQMFFRLDHGELANALQFLSTTKRTGELRIETRGSKKRRTMGRIFLDKGNLLHAECGNEQGIEAVAALLAMEEVEARLCEREATDRKSLRGTTDHILIQASVLGDELGVLRKDFPPETNLERVEEDADASGLEEEASKVFLSIDGVASISAVFNAAGVTGGRGLMIVKSLLELGLVQKVPPAAAVEKKMRSQLHSHLQNLQQVFEKSPEKRGELLDALGQCLQRFSS